MKEVGVVIDYNGYNGIIKTENGEQFLLLKEEIVNNEELKKLDYVNFVKEIYNDPEYTQNIARFVRKINRK